MTVMTGVRLPGDSTVEHVEVDVQPPAVGRRRHVPHRRPGGTGRVCGDLVDVPEPDAVLTERADVELPAPVAVPRAEHGEPARRGGAGTPWLAAEPPDEPDHEVREEAGEDRQEQEQ